MSELIFVVEEAPEGGFLARALGESIFTEADTLAELSDKVRDAVRCHFEEGKAPAAIFALRLTSTASIISRFLCILRFVLVRFRRSWPT